MNHSMEVMLGHRQFKPFALMMLVPAIVRMVNHSLEVKDTSISRLPWKAREGCATRRCALLYRGT